MVMAPFHFSDIRRGELILGGGWQGGQLAVSACIDIVKYLLGL